MFEANSPENGAAEALRADLHIFHPEDWVLQVWKEVATGRTGKDLDIKLMDLSNPSGSSRLPELLENLCQ
jgi:hypothetical protein